MPKAIEVRGDSGAILIEVSDKFDVVAASSEGTAGASDLANKLEDVADTVSDVCKTLHRKIFAALAEAKPDGFELEFGVTLAGEAGVPLVTKGTAECSFKVTAKWGK